MSYVFGVETVKNLVNDSFDLVLGYVEARLA